jgi:hypothetical protein
MKQGGLIRGIYHLSHSEVNDHACLNHAFAPILGFVGQQQCSSFRLSFTCMYRTERVHVNKFTRGL